MTIPVRGFSESMKEQCEQLIKETVPNEFGKAILLFQAIWEGIVYRDWPYEAYRRDYSGIQVKVHAFSNYAGISHKNFQKCLLILEKLDIIEVEINQTGPFYRIFLKKIELDRLCTIYYKDKSEAKSEATAAKKNIENFEKINKSSSEQKIKGKLGPISDADLNFARRLGFSVAGIKVFWSKAASRQAFWDALEMALDRMDSKSEDALGRYANWAIQNPAAVFHYMENTSRRPFFVTTKKNMEILENFCISGTSCIFVYPETRVVFFKLFDGDHSLHLDNKNFKASLENLYDRIIKTERANEGKIPRRKLAVDHSILIPTRRLAPPPLEGNPTTQEDGANAPLASEVSPQLDADKIAKRKKECLALRAEIHAIAKAKCRQVK